MTATLQQDAEFEARVATYRATLDRIPAEHFFAIFAGDLEVWSGVACVCGLALRESLAQTLGRDVDAEELRAMNSGHRAPICAALAVRNGGTSREWHRIFFGAADDTCAVETAVVDRLNALVS